MLFWVFLMFCASIENVSACSLFFFWRPETRKRVLLCVSSLVSVGNLY